MGGGAEPVLPAHPAPPLNPAGLFLNGGARPQRSRLSALLEGLPRRGAGLLKWDPPQRVCWPPPGAGRPHPMALPGDQAPLATSVAAASLCMRVPDTRVVPHGVTDRDPGQ